MKPVYLTTIQFLCFFLLSLSLELYLYDWFINFYDVEEHSSHLLKIKKNPALFKSGCVRRGGNGCAVYNTVEDFLGIIIKVQQTLPFVRRRVPLFT